MGLFLGFPALILRNCGFGVLHDDSDASAIPRIAEQADLDYMWILAFSRGPATYTPTYRLNPVNYRTSNLGYIRIYTVEAKKLETGLRPNSAGIPYICITLIRIEATGFPAFRLLLYIYILETDPNLVDFLYLSIYIYVYIYMYRYML